MNRRLLLLSVVTALTVIAALAIPFIPETAQPVDATLVNNNGETGMRLLPSSLGIPFPPGLQEGDVSYLSDMSPETRSFFMINGANQPEGTRIDLPVRRADGLHHIETEFKPVPFLNGSPLNMATEITGYAMTLLMAALGLLLLWRGHNRAAYGVALWCFASFLQAVFATLPLPVPYGNVLNWCGATLNTLGTLVGLYLIADGLTGEGRPAARRQRTHWLFATVMVLYTVGVTVFNARFYLYGNFTMPVLGNNGISAVIAMHFTAFMMSLSILVFSYRRCSPINQARIRWVLFSLCGLLSTYALGLFASRLQFSIFVLNMMGTGLLGATLIGFAYAVLKHQLVSLQVVLNRALVYGLLTSLVVGVFAAMLSFLERTALNSETNRVVVLVVILLLGMGLDAMKRQVNNYLGKAFFRKRHQAEAALAQFARTCGHVDDTEKLLDLTADELFRNAGPDALSIYLTSPQSSGAAMVRQRGDAPCPPKLDNNDLAFLRLKAGDAEVNLLGVGSALGNDGLLYALQVRSQLLGCIYLGPRPAEAYSAEERQLFERVAHQVAVALHALRLDAQRKLLEELADGGLKSLPMAQAKAKELIGAAG